LFGIPIGLFFLYILFKIGPKEFLKGIFDGIFEGMIPIIVVILIAIVVIILVVVIFFAGNWVISG